LIISTAPAGAQIDTSIRAIQMNELRTALTDALNALTLPLPSFAQSITPGTIVQATDCQELRTAVK
jgi:hypothetical protein